MLDKIPKACWGKPGKVYMHYFITNHDVTHRNIAGSSINSILFMLECLSIEVATHQNIGSFLLLLGI